MRTGRGSPRDDCGRCGCWVCPLGLPRAARHCGIVVCLSSAGWPALSTDARLHQVRSAQGKCHPCSKKGSVSGCCGPAGGYARQVGASVRALPAPSMTASHYRVYSLGLALMVAGIHRPGWIILSVGCSHPTLLQWLLLQCFFPVRKAERGAAQADKPLERAFCVLPWLYGGTVAMVLALVLLKADLTRGWAAWLQATVTLGVGLAVAAAVQCFLVPRLQARVLAAGHVGEVRCALWRRASHAVLVRRGPASAWLPLPCLVCSPGRHHLVMCMQQDMSS